MAIIKPLSTVIFPMNYRVGRSLSKRGEVLFGTGSVLDLNFRVQSSGPGFPGGHSLFLHIQSALPMILFFLNHLRFHIFGSEISELSFPYFKV